MDSERSIGQFAKPYHVRADVNVPWQQYHFHRIESTLAGIGDGTSGLGIQHLTDGTGTVHCSIFHYKYKNPQDTSHMAVEAIMMLDEVNKKLYFFHSDVDSNFTIQETTIEIMKESNGSRAITEFHSVRLFLGHFGVKVPRSNFHTVQCFLNQVDGSIFQVHSIYNPSSTSHYVICWIKLDDSVQIDAPYSDVRYSGKVKVMDKCQVEFPQLNALDDNECGILFSDGGKKMLMRFRLLNPDSINQRCLPEMPVEKAIIQMEMSSPDSFLTHEMTKPPNYAIFGLNYNTHTIQLLTKFVPSSQENHADLLISARLLPTYANGIGFPDSRAKSFLSQRSHMIGQCQKYTFFSTVKTGVIAIVAVKSLMKSIQNGQLSVVPKKIWFPLEDDKVKTAFANLSNKDVKWEMLANSNAILLVIGKEFILEIYRPDDKNYPMGTIRVKFGVEYKDYRKCAGCGKVEEHKRRNKNGKRISQFKVCGWCKDHNLHKVLAIPCHYCSEECADNDWPRHQLEHNKKDKGMKGKGKKKKTKQKPISPELTNQGNSVEQRKAETSQSAGPDHLSPKT